MVVCRVNLNDECRGPADILTGTSLGKNIFLRPRHFRSSTESTRIDAITFRPYPSSGEAKLDVLSPMMSIEEGEVNANSLAATRDKCQVAGYCRASDTLQNSESFCGIIQVETRAGKSLTAQRSIVNTAYGYTRKC